MTPALLTVSRLPIELRVLRGCAYCGKHVMAEAEFLAWLAEPRGDAGCQHCGTVKTAQAAAVALAEAEADADES